MSFGGEYYNRDKQADILDRAAGAGGASAIWGDGDGGVSARAGGGGRRGGERFGESFRFLNVLGKMAFDDFGVRIGLHNHTDSMIETPAQVTRFLEGTDPRHVFCAWDTAHLHLGGCDVVATFRQSIDRIVYTDFKDATRMPTSDDYVAPTANVSPAKP